MKLHHTELTPGKYLRTWAGYTIPVEIRRCSDGGPLHEIAPSGNISDPDTMPDATWEKSMCDDSENAILRGAMARLCRAVSRRMMPDEPTPDDRMELMEAYDAAAAILPNAVVTNGQEDG